MKAVIVEQFAPLSKARYTDAEDPTPGPGEVIVDVKAAETNFPDLLVIEGNYQIKPPLPFSPGKAAAGVVSELGEGVHNLKLGDRVAVQVEYGAYAEKLRTSAATCYPMPDAMPFDVAAALGLVYQTSHFALVERAAMKPGESVLVLGAAGGIGSAAVQLARALGASCVIGAVRGEANAAVARELGCDRVIELTGDDLNERMREEVRAATGGKGADIVMDPVGGSANAAALRAMAWCGRMVILGFAAGDIPQIRANYILVKNIAVTGLHWSDYRERDPGWVARVQAEIFDLWSAGKLAPHISRRLPLAQFAEALEVLRAGKAQCKLILTVGED